MLYGLSIGAISTVIFFRMYMMLTFFTTLYLYINIKIYKNKFELTKQTRFALILTAVLGFLTQYFFVIYAAILSITMIILGIVEKEHTAIKKYIVTLTMSAIIGIWIFPFSIKHLLFSQRGVLSTTQRNYISCMYEYFKLILKYFGSEWEIALALLAIALLAIMIKRKKERGLMSLIIAPVVIYIVLITPLSDFIELRYIMNILPIVSILIILAVGTIFENNTYNTLVAVFAVIILIGYGFVSEKPLYLYKDYDEYIEIAEKYKDDNFVFVGYSFFNHLQSMPEFMKYNKSLMIFNDELFYLNNNKELSDKDEFILSINISMNPEETAKDIVQRTGYKNYELLYDGKDGRGGEGIEQIIYRIYK